MNISYGRSGDYLIPNLTVPEQPSKAIGKYGLMHLDYIKEHKSAHYRTLKMAGKLPNYLLDIQEAANKRLAVIQQQMLMKDPPPDNATDQLGWVRHMNSIKSAAEEIIMQELIYA